MLTLHPALRETLVLQTCSVEILIRENIGHYFQVNGSFAVTRLEKACCWIQTVFFCQCIILLLLFAYTTGRKFGISTIFFKVTMKTFIVLQFLFQINAVLSIHQRIKNITVSSKIFSSTVVVYVLVILVWKYCEKYIFVHSAVLLLCYH